MSNLSWTLFTSTAVFFFFFVFFFAHVASWAASIEGVFIRRFFFFFVIVFAIVPQWWNYCFANFRLKIATFIEVLVIWIFRSDQWWSNLGVWGST
jgi:hypothetical protein